MSVSKALRFKALVFSRDYNHYLAHKVQCWLLILMILGYLGAGGLSMMLMLESYANPEWETKVDPRSETQFPVVSICSLEGIPGDPYYPTAVGCSYRPSFWSTDGAVDCLDNFGTSLFGPVQAFGCVDVNTDGAFKGSNLESTLIVLAQRSLRQTAIDGLGVTLRPPRGWTGPENWQTFGNGNWVLITINPVERYFLNGTREIRYEMEGSAVPFESSLGAPYSAFNIRFSAMSATKSTELVRRDFIWLLATMGGLAGACSLANKFMKWLRDLFCFDDRQYDRLLMAHNRDDDVLVAAIRKEMVALMQEDKQVTLKQIANSGPYQPQPGGGGRDTVQAF